MYTALLSSLVATACIYVTSCSCYESHSPENLQNELRLDPVSALAAQCTRTETVTVTLRTLLREVVFGNEQWLRSLASSSFQIQ